MDFPLGNTGEHVPHRRVNLVDRVSAHTEIAVRVPGNAGLRRHAVGARHRGDDEAMAKPGGAEELGILGTVERDDRRAHGRRDVHGPAVVAEEGPAGGRQRREPLP